MCSDPKQDCSLLKAGVCTSPLPMYCEYFPKPEVKVSTVKKIETPRVDVNSEIYKWAHHDITERIAART